MPWDQVVESGTHTTLLEAQVCAVSDSFESKQLIRCTPVLRGCMLSSCDANWAALRTRKASKILGRRMLYLLLFKIHYLLSGSTAKDKFNTTRIFLCRSNIFPQIPTCVQYFTRRLYCVRLHTLVPFISSILVAQ